MYSVGWLARPVIYWLNIRLLNLNVKDDGGMKEKALEEEFNSKVREGERGGGGSKNQ